MEEYDNNTMKLLQMKSEGINEISRAAFMNVFNLMAMWHQSLLEKVRFECF